jgi:hypothetical protein
MNGRRNRNKGHTWERKVVAMLRHAFPGVMTSRKGSYLADSLGIDIIGVDGLAVQCKNYATKPNFSEELDKIASKEIKVLAFKHNKIRGQKGEYAVLYFDDFVKLLEKIYV